MTWRGGSRPAWRPDSEADLAAVVSAVAGNLNKAPIEVSKKDFIAAGYPERACTAYGSWADFKQRHFGAAEKRPHPGWTDETHKPMQVWDEDRPELGEVVPAEDYNEQTDPGRDDSPGVKILIIPDAHAHPDYSNERFTALGRMIAHERPDHVVCIGDWFDMPSLSSYDKGTRGFEGRRYKRDIHSGVEAQNLMFGEALSSRWVADSTRWTMTLGNHEDRVNRVTQAHPELYETIGTEDMLLERWHEVVPFKESASIAGIQFSHYFASGVAGRAISGVNIGRSMVTKLHASAVQGHSHLYDHHENTRPDGTKLFGLSVGCYSHPEQVEGWNAQTAHMWWRGIVILENARHGYYDEIRAITMRKILREYL